MFLLFSFVFLSLHMLHIYFCMLSTLSIIAPSIFIILGVQFLSHVRVFVTPWTAANQASLSFTISWSLLKLMSIESVIPFNHLIQLYNHSWPKLSVWSFQHVCCVWFWFSNFVYIYIYNLLVYLAMFSW